MALSIDTSQPLRGTTDLRSLVEAVVAATEHDENDWVEWKSDLNLTTKEGCFVIARHVLGMANRLPDRATATCGGLGYLVIGAEPGNLQGISSVDPARLDQLIEPYVGGVEGPRWTPTYISDDRKTVLIVSVEAPRPGDRIFALRKEFQQYRSGTVFVRKQGRTVPADADDLDALQARLASTLPVNSAALDVRAIGDLPLSWFDSKTVRAAIDRWADDRRHELIAEARAVERSGNQPAERGLTGLPGLQGSFAAMAAQQDSLRRALQQAGGAYSFLASEDTRSFDEYLEDVEKWRDDLVEASIDALPGVYVANGHGVLALEVENLGSRFLPDVEIEVRFEFDGASGTDEEPLMRRLPSPPRAYGKPKPTVDFLSSRLISPDIASPYLPEIAGIGRRTWVEDGSVIVKFHIGDLRQHATDTSDDVYVFISNRPDDGVLHGTWRGTVRDVDGVVEGTIDVPVADQPVDVVALLKTKRPDD